MGIVYFFLEYNRAGDVYRLTFLMSTPLFHLCFKVESQHWVLGWQKTIRTFRLTLKTELIIDKVDINQTYVDLIKCPRTFLSTLNPVFNVDLNALVFILVYISIYTKFLCQPYKMST